METKPKPKELDLSFLKDTGKSQKNYSTGDVYVPGGFGSNGNEKNLDVANLENIDDLRGENQSRWDKVGNGAAKFIGKTILRTAGGLLTPIVGLGAMLASGKLSSIYDNSVNDFLKQSEDALNEALPNYRTDEQKTSLSASVFSTDFWADSLLDGASFALSAYLSGKGIAGGIGAVSKLLGKAGNVSEAVTALKGADEIGGDLTTLGNIGTRSRTGSIIKEGFGTLVGAVNESALEAKGSYDQVRQTLMQQTLAAKQAKGDYSEITEEESQALDSQAAKAANVNFGLNLVMTWGTNALQMGKLFRSYKNEAIDAAKVIGKAGEYSYDANRVGGAIQSVLDESPKLAKALSARNRGIINYFGSDILSEAGQEFGQNYSNELVATHYAGSTGGKEREWLDSMGKALDKSLGKDGYESALLGAIIGGVTGGATGSLSEAKRTAEDGQKAVDFANTHSLNNFINQNQVKSFLRVNALDTQADQALSEGRKFDWLNLRAAKFHEMVMGQYEIGKFDDLIDNLKTMQEATPAEAKELLGIETDEDTRADFAKGLIEKAKATKANYEKMIGLVGHKIASGEVDKEAIAQAALAGALADDMDTRMKDVKKNLNDMGFNIDEKTKERIEKYRNDPEGQARISKEYDKQIKETAFSLRAESNLGKLSDPIKIKGFNDTLSKLSGEKTKLADYFSKHVDNDNYIDAFDSFSKDFLNDLEEKTTRDYANNKVTPTNRQDFETQITDYRKLEKAKKGFYDFYNDVVTKGNASERLQKVRKLVEQKKNDQWLDRWYGVYQKPQQTDKDGNKVDSPRIQLEPGMYAFRNKIPGINKLSAKENVVEIKDRRLNEGRPEILIKENGNDEVWKPVRAYNAIGLKRLDSKMGTFGSSEYRDVEDLLNPEMQFYLKNKDRVIEYYQPDLAYLEKGGKVVVKSVMGLQGDDPKNRIIKGMLAFDKLGHLTLRFYDKEGKPHTSIGGYAVNSQGKLLLNSSGQKIKVPAFAVSRTTWGKTGKKGEAGSTNTSIQQNYMRIYTEDETNQYLFEESYKKNVARLESYIETVKNGDGKDFQSIADIEHKLKNTFAEINRLGTRIIKTSNPKRLMKLEHMKNQLWATTWDLDQQIRTKNQIIAQVKDQLAGLEARPDTYDYKELEEDFKTLIGKEYEQDTPTLDEEKKERKKAKDRFALQKAFARQLQNDVDILTFSKEKLTNIQSEVENKVAEWASNTLTGSLADQIIGELETSIPGITERYQNKELSFDDVNEILRNITKDLAKTSYFNIAFNQTKNDLAESIKVLANTFEEQAATELTQAYVRDDAITPLAEVEEELKQIELLREALTKDYSDSTKDPFIKDKVNGVFDAGDEITTDEKQQEDLFVIPDTKHNGAYNPFLRTQTPQQANHNQNAFRATALFNSKNRYEEGKYSYELFTHDMATSRGIVVDNPTVADVIFLRLINNRTGKPVQLDSLGNEKASGQYPHLSVLPEASFKYAYTDKQGKPAERYRFRDVNADNESEFNETLVEFKGIRSQVLADLKAGKEIRWAINRKSYGIPRYDSAPNPIKSVVNDPHFMTELLKPAGLTTDGKIDYTKGGDYVIHIAETNGDTLFPGTDITYPTKSGRTYLVDKKSKRVMPLVNRKLNADEITNLLRGIIYTSNEGNRKANQDTKSFRADFINFFAKNYINWGNRVSQKKPTNAGYHIDFSNDLVNAGIVFGKYTGVTKEGKGIYGTDGKETTVTYAEIEEYLKNPYGDAITPAMKEFASFLESTHRHISAFNLKNDYKPVFKGKQQAFIDYEYVQEADGIQRYPRKHKQGYKSWLLSSNALQSPIVPVKDTQAQYDGIYYGIRNEAPAIASPNPKKATGKKVKDVTEITTPEASTAPTESRLKQLRKLVATFGEGKEQLQAILTELDEMIHPETNTVATEEEILLTLGQPDIQEALTGLLSDSDGEQLQNWFDGKPAKVKAKPVEVETEAPEETPPTVEEDKSLEDLLSSLPKDTLTDILAVGATFNIANNIYTVQSVAGGKVSAKLGETVVEFNEDTLRQRLAPRPIDDVVYMDFDENLVGQPVQNNSKNHAQLQEYFNTRYGLDVSIVNAKELFGNFAAYMHGAKKILMQSETPEGAEYHEEFHVVEKMLLPSKRAEIYNSWRRATGKSRATDTEVSEALAEGFRYYVLNQKVSDKSLLGKIANFFKQFKELLESLLKIKKVSKLYKDIYSGAFTQKPKRHNIRASAFNVSTREAIIDNMWYNIREVAKENKINLVNLFTRLSGDYKTEMDKQNDALIIEGKNGLLMQTLIRSVREAQPTIRKQMVENHEELIELFNNSIRRKLNKKEEEIEEEDSNDIMGMLTPANQVDHKSRVPTIIKTVLSSIPARKRNALGLESGANLNHLLGKLYTNLAGLQTLDQMRDKLNNGDEQLKQVANAFGLNANLASLITSGNVNKLLPNMMSQAQFVNHFAKQNVNYFTYQIKRDGTVVSIDEKRSAVIKPMIAKWKTAINTARRKPGFPYGQDGGTQWDYKKLLLAAKDNGAEVLRVLGITQVHSKNIDLAKGLYFQLRDKVTTIADIVPAITENWSDGNRAMQMELAGEGKDLTMNMQNAEGKTINSITEQSGLSKRIDEINEQNANDIQEGTKTRIEVVSLAGLKPDTGNGVVVSDLGPRDSALVQYNSILKGIIPYVFTGSKSMAWGLQGLRNYEAFGDISDITDQYIHYLEKEYNSITQWVRMKRDNTVLPKGYLTGGGELSVFKNILPPNTVKKLTENALAEDTFEKAFKKFKSGANRKLIETAIQTHVNARSISLLNQFENDKIVSLENGEYKLFGIEVPAGITKYQTTSRDGLQRLTRDLYINNELANLEQWQEIIGHYSYFKDPLKRITALTATKQNADGVGSLANYIAFATNTNSSTFVLNRIARQEPLGQLTNITINDIEIAGNEELQKINSKYAEINVADGQGYGAMEHHRMLGFFEGWWNDNLERIYQHEVELEKKIYMGRELSDTDLLPLEDIKQYWKVVKTQYFGGQILDNHNEIAPNMLKFSVLPLLPSMTYGQPIDKLRKWMNDTGTAIASVNSANKVGRLVNVETGNGFAGTNFDMEGAEDYVQNLDWKYYGTQTATADEPHTKQIEGTQAAKIVTADILSLPTVTSYITKKDGSHTPINTNSRTWVNQLLALKSGRIAREFTTLKHRLSIKQVDEDHYEIADKEIFHAKVVEAVEARTNAQGILTDLDTLFDNGQPLDYLPKAQIDGIIWGLVKKPIKHKRFGDAKVQVSTAGLGVFNKESGTLQQSSELGFYPVGQDGTSYAMDVMLPSWYKTDLPIGEIIKLDARLAEVVGFRIPTQALASIEYIRVVKFLPKHSNFIVVPAPITGKAGSDFDVDKMNLYFPNVRYTKNSTPEYIEYGVTSDEALYTQFINSINELDLTDEPQQAYQEYKKKLSYRRNYIQGRLMGAKNRINPENLKQIWAKINTALEGGSTNVQKLVKSYKQLTDNEGDSLSLSDKLGNLQEGLEFYTKMALGKDNADVKVVEDILDLLAKYTLTRKVTDRLKVEKEKLMGELQTSLDTIASDHYERSKTLASINNYPSFEEFKTWPTEEKETIEAVDNKILEWEKATLASSNNREHLLSPNQDDNIKRAAYWVQLMNAQQSGKLDQKKPFKLSLKEFRNLSEEEYEDWQKKLKFMRPIDLINPMFLETNRQSFQAGKTVLGAIAKSVTHHVISQLAGLHIMKGGTYKRTVYSKTDEKVIQQEDAFEPPLFKVTDGYDLSKFKNVDGEWISRILSEYVNASVDVEKDDYIKYINLSIENASVYMYLLRQGVKPDNVVLFMSQPIITSYTNRLNLYQSESYKVQRGITSATMAKNKAIEDTIKEYGSAPKRRDNFTMKELEMGIRTGDRQFQAQIFEEYLKNMSIGNVLTDLMSATDFDTKDTGSSYAENALRVYKYQKWISGNTLFSTKDFDGIQGFMKFMDNGAVKLTPLGQAARITETASDLFDDLSVIERQFNYSHLYDDMIKPMLDSMYGTDKVSKAISKIKNGFLTFVLQNTKVDGKLLSERKELLNGDTGLAKQILTIKEQPNHPLATNYFLDQLEIILHGAENADEVNMRKIMGDELKVDQLYEAFLEIEDSDPQLALDMIDYSILRSGVDPSPISYHQAIPIKSIAARYGTLDQYVDTRSFKELFLANNLKDPVIASAFNVKKENPNDTSWSRATVMKEKGDGMYRKDYKVDFESVAEIRNIGMRERIVSKIGADALNKYERETNSTVEEENKISAEEKVSEAKLKQIIIAIQKAIC